MKAVFFGTPAFAVPSLDAVLAVCDVGAVVTQPDRPRGRGSSLEASPVAVAAHQYALDVWKPESLRDPGFLADLRRERPDVLVVVAYGRLIPPAAIDAARLRGINLHPSLLPRYRGAAPIPRAIAAGERETGVTVLYLASELDAGDIILQRAVPVLDDDTAATLEARLAREGAALLADALRLLDAGTAPRRPQDHARASFAPKLSRQEALIAWDAPAARIVNLIRAFDPWPVAYTLRDGEPLMVWRASAVSDSRCAVVPASGTRPAPGTVVAAGSAEPPFVVVAGEGCVVLHEVQPASGRRMPAGAYLRGHPLAAGTVLGTGRPRA